MAPSEDPEELHREDSFARWRKTVWWIVVVLVVAVLWIYVRR